MQNGKNVFAQSRKERKSFGLKKFGFRFFFARLAALRETPFCSGLSGAGS